MYYITAEQAWIWWKWLQLCYCIDEELSQLEMSELFFPTLDFLFLLYFLFSSECKLFLHKSRPNILLGKNR